MKLQLNPQFNLYERNGQPFCDSLMIAETFEKIHGEILKTLEGENRKGMHIDGLIDDLIRSSVNTLDYFIKTTYKDSQNKTQPKYLMSRDGFALLTFGFTGSKALKFKLDYINRFNQMDEFIKTLLSTKVEFPAFTESIMLAHNEPKPYHFTNEINLIYRIVLGMDAKAFRQENGLDPAAAIKPYLTAGQLKAIETLQRVDIGLHEAAFSYEQRKEVLTKRYHKMLLKISA